MNEYILIFPGFGPEPGWCHVIADEDDRRSALVGELQDNPGTSVTNALEQVAEAVASESFDGEHDFAAFQFVPRGLPDLKPTFYEIKWNGNKRRFDMPTWEPLSELSPWLQRAETLVRQEDYTAVSLKRERGLPIVDTRTPAVDPVERLGD